MAVLLLDFQFSQRRSLKSFLQCVFQHHGSQSGGNRFTGFYFPCPVFGLYVCSVQASCWFGSVSYFLVDTHNIAKISVVLISMALRTEH